MALHMVNGNYISDGQGGFEGVSGGYEVLERALFRLTVRRGSFPFLPELGSELYRLLREKPSVRGMLARQYVEEALADETDLSVTDVTVVEKEDGMGIHVALSWQGERLEGEVLL